MNLRLPFRQHLPARWVGHHHLSSFPPSFTSTIGSESFKKILPSLSSSSTWILSSSPSSDSDEEQLENGLNGDHSSPTSEIEKVFSVAFSPVGYRPIATASTHILHRPTPGTDKKLVNFSTRLPILILLFRR
ncbi:hypothetical protein L2E82_44091 [Cichorium intybus]|uniref:Uncharacterized protein n=1 Tax=Cichorium intybus TaxID=13427 RepID=A0ACB8ZNU1_CICIN|nr:hypothetical protein L2E82_44091 [Cichorium intybus]